jgi:hypothetical protein
MIEMFKRNKWLHIVVLAFIFVVARQLYEGGMFAFVGDTITEVSTSEETAALQKEMLQFLLPIGVAGLCMNKFGRSQDLIEAVKSFNDRHNKQMEILMREIKLTGGMSPSRKSYINRLAYQQAEDFLGKSGKTKTKCAQLARLINSGEFDQ